MSPGDVRVTATAAVSPLRVTACQACLDAVRGTREHHAVGAGIATQLRSEAGIDDPEDVCVIAAVDGDPVLCVKDVRGRRCR